MLEFPCLSPDVAFLSDMRHNGTPNRMIHELCICVVFDRFTHRSLLKLQVVGVYVRHALKALRFKSKRYTLEGLIMRSIKVLHLFRA